MTLNNLVWSIYDMVNISWQLSNSSKWIGNQQIANAQVNENNVRVKWRRFDELRRRLRRFV